MQLFDSLPLQQQEKDEAWLADFDNTNKTEHEKEQHLREMNIAAKIQKGADSCRVNIPY